MRVLVISPHPDDDVIGCGGTLRRHVLDGDTVRVIYLTSGEKGGHGRPPDETARLREDEARAAAQILGLHGLEFWRLPDGGCRATQELVDRLNSVLSAWAPQRIYVPHAREMHPDHRAAARLVRRSFVRLREGVLQVWGAADLPGRGQAPTAYPMLDADPFQEGRAEAAAIARPQRDVHQLRERELPVVAMYEVWTPLQEMDEIVDISAYLDEKLAVVRAHKSQCDVLKFDEAIRGLNRYRGEMHSWPGGDYAEVFQWMRP